jgi:hypothetical protein
MLPFALHVPASSRHSSKRACRNVRLLRPLETSCSGADLLKPVPEALVPSVRKLVKGKHWNRDFQVVPQTLGLEPLQKRCGQRFLAT